jgi:lipopolysaccharide transport system ATP-binding protein
MPPIVRVENVGKCYRIDRAVVQGRHRYRTLRESLVAVARSPLRRWRGGAVADQKEEFWALQGVDFEVEAGEVVGIIGRNGAGKSTLLKILSRITRPTTGRIELHGRVGSLLEVGSGFHPELTGRENIFMNGSILGMNRREIARKFDEIVAFAEIDQFLDTPVKRYSSGMYVRLAFAVAAHLEPEIFIIDEVLAVGDAQFQKKCLEKMDEVKSAGRTLLLVSHQMQVIQAVTKRSFLLDRGRIVKTGATADVVAAYQGSSRHYTDLRHFQQFSTGEAQLLELRVTTDSSDCPTEVVRGETLRIALTVLVKQPIRESNCSMAIRNANGVELFSHSWSDQYSKLLRLMPGKHEYIVSIPTRHLRPGSHWLSLCLAKNEADVVVDTQGVELPPLVLEPTANSVIESRRWGVVYVDCEWEYRNI